MRIGIDISQIVYEGTGVARYVRLLVRELLTQDTENTYILFGASLRRRREFLKFFETIKSIHHDLQLVVLPIPPSVLDFFWNRLHIIPIEWLIGPVDIFWSSDWTQPPLMTARGVSTIHDLAIFRYPESFANIIVDVQKRRLHWAKKECDLFLCDSLATLNDAIEYLAIPRTKLRVVYPGIAPFVSNL